VRTLAYQINDAGVVAGYYTTNGPSSPFVFEYNGASFTTISLPGSTSTDIAGFNNASEIVGQYGTTANTLVQYLYDGSTFKSFSLPGIDSTSLTGIGNNVTSLENT
jgi:hypothetical protein